MTVTFLGEDHEARKGENNTGVRTYSRAFKLKSSVDAEGPYTVGSDVNLPVLGSVHPEDSAAYVTSVSIEQVAGKYAWKYSVSYSTERVLATDPTLDPAIVTLSTEQFQKPAVFDLSGNGIANSAGDPYDPPNMMDDSRRQFSVTKNMAVVPSWVIDSQDSVNSDSFSLGGLTIAIGLAKVQSVSVGEPQERNGVSFRVVTFQIQVQREGWILKPLDAGFREIGASGIRLNIVNDGDNQQPTAPVPLDGSGVALVNPTLTNAVFGSHVVYQSMAFSGLPLT